MKKFSLKVFGVGLLALLGFGFIGLTNQGITTTNHAYAQNVVDSSTNNLGAFGDVGQTEGLGVAGAGTQADSSLIDIVKNFINWTLGILGLIALVVLLRGGFQMVTAAGDEDKYKKGFKILKQAAVGLIFIGIAYFMVSIVLWLIGKVAGGSSNDQVAT